MLNRACACAHTGDDKRVSISCHKYHKHVESQSGTGVAPDFLPHSPRRCVQTVAVPSAGQRLRARAGPAFNKQTSPSRVSVWQGQWCQFAHIVMWMLLTMIGCIRQPRRLGRPSPQKGLCS